MVSRASRALTFTLLSVAVTVVGVSPARSLPSEKPVVEFQNGRMSIHASGAPLKAILAEMQQTSGVAVELKDPEAAERPVSIDVQDLRPPQAFRRVLRDLNYAFVYSADRLVQVVIVPRGVGISAPPPAKEPRGTKRDAELGDRVERGPLKAKRESRALKRQMDPRVRAELATIGELEESEDPKSVVALGNMLADPSVDVRRAALSALTDKEGSLATQMIRRGLNDRTPELRIEALEALAERNDTESLRRGMTDPDEDVRERAAELLEGSTP
jgi:hypothetical protein